MDDEMEPVEAEEVQPEEIVNEEDVPTQFMGRDFSDIPAAARKEVFDALTQQESYIGKLQQKLAERRAEPEAVPVAQQSPQVPAPSDDEILAAFGYNPESSYYEVIKEAVLPMAKQNLALMGQVDWLNEQVSTEAAWDNWNESLDKLESVYGELPVDRDTVTEFAIDQGISDPEVAYYRLAMGAQKVLEEAASAQRQKAQQQTRQVKRQSTPLRGGGQQIPTQSTPLESTGNLAEDIKRAAMQAEKELGVSWDDAAQSFLNRR